MIASRSNKNAAKTIKISWADDKGNSGVTEHTIPDVTYEIKKVLDEYALDSGQHWCCSYAGFCARGVTPGEAEEKLTQHFEDMRRMRYAP